MVIDNNPIEQNMKQLIAVLKDKSARIDERDDAAMDLSSYDTPEVCAALLEVALDPETDEIIAASCGESLAEIWDTRGTIDIQSLDLLSGPARAEALNYLQAKHPEWIK